MNRALHRLDLNLLVTLQILLSERSVTRAAKRLSVTPSAVSKSLTKLRHWFDDPLLVRSPQGLLPTPLALGLAEELAELFQLASSIVAKRNVEVPKGVEFQLMLESPFYLELLPELPGLIDAHFPDSVVRIRNWDYDSLDAIISGKADLGLSGRESHPGSRETLALLPAAVDYEVLFSDEPLVYLRKDHPALQQVWSLETFLEYRQINIEWEKCEGWALDSLLAEKGLKRDIALSVSLFEQSLWLASQPGSQLLTTAPGYCRTYAARTCPELVTRPLPMVVEDREKLTILFTLMWHKRNSHNPKLRWLKETIRRQLEQRLSL